MPSIRCHRFFLAFVASAATLAAQTAPPATPPSAATPPAAAPAQTSPPPPRFQPTPEMLAQQAASEKEHQRELDALGIKSLRPGADGDASSPRAANYDESKADVYPNLPDPLLLANGKRVTTPKQWWTERRPQIVALFDENILGRTPAHLPGVKWELVSTTPEKNGDVAVITKKLIGHVDNSADPAIKVDIDLELTVPANAHGPVPVVMELGFSREFMEQMRKRFPQFGAQQAQQGPTWQQQVLAKGWGYAEYVPTSVQPDNGAGLTEGIIGLVNHGQPRSLDDWGALKAWGWGASKCLDYFETDSSVDAKQVALEGHSRYGKATIVTMAYDSRFAIAFVSSSGEGGAKLYRHIFGETVPNVAGAQEFHWMAANFMKYAGPLTPGDMPVDNHELIALCAPRPVFISGGATKGDGWVDAKGMFLAAAAAGPVYKLLGKKDLGATEFPPIETTLIDGDIAFRQHTAGHTPAPNWPTFITFASRYLHAPANTSAANPASTGVESNPKLESKTWVGNHEPPPVFFTNSQAWVPHSSDSFIVRWVGNHEPKPVSLTYPRSRAGYPSTRDDTSQSPTQSPLLTAQQDRDRLLNLLHIQSIRPPASSDPAAPNAANYDESKANPYPNLPDPLLLTTGTTGSRVKSRVTTADQWWSLRRPQILSLYDHEILGQPPANLPSVDWQVVATTHETYAGIPVLTRRLSGRVDNRADPAITVDIDAVLTIPANAPGPVPVIVELAFANDFMRAIAHPTADATERKGTYGVPWQPVLARGWGFAVLSPASIQADDGAGLTQGIIGLMNHGQPRSLDDWGALKAWAWGAGRLLDYLATDPAVDAHQVAIAGHSRFGKAALVTMAYDPRFAVAYISSSGEGGAKLYRHIYGEPIANVASPTEYHWMAGNFLRYAGSLNAGNLPIDNHELIALCAPRPVFIGGGASTGDGYADPRGDAWADARGMFLAEVAATPVYRLLGVEGLQTARFPPVETALTTGTLAFRQHNSGHTPVPNWPAFLDFASKYLHAPAHPQVLATNSSPQP